ncbi:MAG TPA: MlaD family protein [Solirubrobacterales bacterium]|nr:MlaD family protein [Solirubrobacterales bacterium]
MRRAIREHLRDFVAILALTLLALAVTVGILSQQQYPYPEWIPFLGKDRFELKAEFSTVQAVTPGQGQTVNIAGVKAGDVTEVNLEGGDAVVTMSMEEEYAPLVHEDATMLLRPRTGLQDMTLEMDPGTRGEAVEEGSTIPLSQTQPNIQPDEILATLDGDTQAYLKLLLEGGAQGFGGHGKEFSAGLRRLEPFARDVAKINKLLAQRRQSIRGSIHNFRLVAEELGRNDRVVADWVDSSNAALQAFANEEASIRETLREAPSALRETQRALRSSNRFSLASTPALRKLIPAARTLGPALRESRPFFRQTAGPIRNQIRPFTRAVQEPFRHLQQASGPLDDTSKSLESGIKELNEVFNALAFNPDGPQESYLFWAAWLNHNLNALSFIQDAHGPIPRGLVLVSCATAGLAENVAGRDLTYETLLDLNRVVRRQQIQDLGGCGPN